MGRLGQPLALRPFSHLRSKSHVPSVYKRVDATEARAPLPAKPKAIRGWIHRHPFYVLGNKNWAKSEHEKNTYWSDLTLREKLDFRKNFLQLYLSETKECLPYVRKFFLMIYRTSPWRVMMLLALNVITGLIPAMTMQARGNFISMVRV
jgi:hypothetical protein